MSAPKDEQRSEIESMSIGVMVESLRPSQFWSVLKWFVCIGAALITSGIWIAQWRHDLDFKAHQLQDAEIRIKDWAEHTKYERKIEQLEAENAKLKAAAAEDAALHKELPPKDSVKVLVGTKEGRGAHKNRSK